MRGVEAVAIARDVQRPETLCREAVELTLVSSRVPCLPGAERRISRDSGVTVAIYPSERTHAIGQKKFVLLSGPVVRIPLRGVSIAGTLVFKDIINRKYQ
ncbi:hypothetical protein NAG74_28950 [Sinorhizobium meliloti]|nr:hypothetical protein [Sinorhizobium meliloti]MCO5965780.1 hypothetical protein [Sinorhizobium meliloti]